MDALQLEDKIHLSTFTTQKPTTGGLRSFVGTEQFKKLSVWLRKLPCAQLNTPTWLPLIQRISAPDESHLEKFWSEQGANIPKDFLEKYTGVFWGNPRIFLTDYKQYDAETLLEHADRSHHESLQMVLNAGVEIIPLRGRLPTGALEFLWHFLPHVPHSQDVLQKHVCSDSCLKKLKHRPRHRKTRSAHFKRLSGLCGHSGSILQRVCFFYRKYKPKYPACVSSRI